MNVHTYKTKGDKDVIEEYLDDLPAKESAAGYDILTSLKEDGIVALDNYYSKHFIGKIWEIKFRKNNRMFYVIFDSENIYILHACKKQKNKAEEIDKNKAINRAKELEIETGKKYI